MRKSGGGEAGEGGEDDASSESTEPAQTLLEIDYNTVIDNEDVIDEFGLFKNLLEGKKKISNKMTSLELLKTCQNDSSGMDPCMMGMKLVSLISCFLF